MDPDIPQEILHLFIKELGIYPHGDNRTALRSCLFVSHSFRIFSRTELFRSIELFEDDIQSTLPKRIERACELLEASDETGIQYASFVKQFDLCLVAMSDDSSLHSLFTCLDRPALVSIFERLHGEGHGVESFAFDVSTWEANPFPWDLLPLGLRAAIYGVLHSPQLRHLSLFRIRDLPPSFLRGTRLKSVHLVNVYNQSWEGAEDETANSYKGLALPRLRYLFTNHSFPIDNILPNPDHKKSYLRELSVRMDRARDFASVAEILRRTVRSLTTLRFLINEDVLGDAFPPGFQCDDLSKVNHISVTLHMDSKILSSTEDDNSTENFILFIAFIPCLIKPTMFPGLQFLELEITTRSAVPTEPACQFSHPAWRQLHEALMPRHFPRLSTVRFGLKCEFTFRPRGSESEFDLDAFERATKRNLAAVLPSLEASGVLHLAVGVWGHTMAPEDVDSELEEDEVVIGIDP